MLVRLALASCAVALCPLALLAAVAACGGGQRPPAGVSAGAMDGGSRDGARDAPPPPLFGGACPDDAPWTGAVCLGQGYVACPGGYSMDDRSRCVHDVPAVTAAAAAVSPDASDDDDTD
jgi:hypothetical protein